MAMTTGTRILVIDDLRTFPDLGDVVYARTSAEACKLLFAVRAWDQVWWDHDLGGDDHTMKCVDMLERYYNSDRQTDIGLCVIHTSNPVGGDNLMRVLKRMYPCQRVYAGGLNVVSGI